MVMNANRPAMGVPDHGMRKIAYGLHFDQQENSVSLSQIANVKIGLRADVCLHAVSCGRGSQGPVLGFSDRAWKGT